MGLLGGEVGKEKHTKPKKNPNFLELTLISGICDLTLAFQVNLTIYILQLILVQVCHQ